MRAICLAVTVFLLSAPGVALAQGFSGPTRIDFDDRLIQGQTKKAGSVYIYNRQQIEIQSLVSIKRTFRQKVIRTIFEGKQG
ncbi:MAG: hypothetical protein AAFQ82_12035 [Myxococcota bacterium]